jgi:hypothetical protein
MRESLSVLVERENSKPAQPSNLALARFPDSPSSLRAGIIAERDVANNTDKALAP